MSRDQGRAAVAMPDTDAVPVRGPCAPVNAARGRRIPMERTGHAVPLRAGSHSDRERRSGRIGPAGAVGTPQIPPPRGTSHVFERLPHSGSRLPLRSVRGDAMVSAIAAVRGPVFRFGHERAMVLRALEHFSAKRGPVRRRRCNEIEGSHVRPDAMRSGRAGIGQSRILAPTGAMAERRGTDRTHLAPARFFVVARPRKKPIAPDGQRGR